MGLLWRGGLPDSHKRRNPFFMVLLVQEDAPMSSHSDASRSYETDGRGGGACQFFLGKRLAGRKFFR